MFPKNISKIRKFTEILDKKRKRRLKFEITNHLQDSIFIKFSSLSLNGT